MNSLAQAFKEIPGNGIKFDINQIRLDKLTRNALSFGYNLFELNVGVEYMHPGTCNGNVIDKLKLLKEEEDLRYTIHLPFLGLEPATANKHLRQAVVNCQVEIINLTKCLEPENYVLHSSGGIAPLFLLYGKKYGISNLSLKEMTESAILAVGEILDQTNIASKKIAIENVTYPFESTLDVIEQNNCSYLPYGERVLNG